MHHKSRHHDWMATEMLYCQHLCVCFQLLRLCCPVRLLGPRSVLGFFQFLLSAAMDSLMGNKSKDASWPKNLRKCASISTRWTRSVCSYDTKEVLCLLLLLVMFSWFLTPSLPGCYLKITNKSAKLETLKPFCLLVALACEKDFHQNA